MSHTGLAAVVQSLDMRHSTHLPDGTSQRGVALLCAAHSVSSLAELQARQSIEAQMGRSSGQ
jgi:hypothetical protein